MLFLSLLAVVRWAGGSGACGAPTSDNPWTGHDDLDILRSFRWIAHIPLRIPSFAEQVMPASFVSGLRLNRRMELTAAL